MGDVFRILNISKLAPQHYQDKGIIPTPKLKKSPYRLSDINRLLQENYVKHNTL